jgi:hypothetical protein
MTLRLLEEIGLETGDYIRLHDALAQIVTAVDGVERYEVKDGQLLYDQRGDAYTVGPRVTFFHRDGRAFTIAFSLGAVPAPRVVRVTNFAGALNAVRQQFTSSGGDVEINLRGTFSST